MIEGTIFRLYMWILYLYIFILGHNQLSFYWHTWIFWLTEPYSNKCSLYFSFFFVIMFIIKVHFNFQNWSLKKSAQGQYSCKIVIILTYLTLTQSMHFHYRNLSSRQRKTSFGGLIYIKVFLVSKENDD